MTSSLVGSEMCIRDSLYFQQHIIHTGGCGNNLHQAGIHSNGLGILLVTAPGIIGCGRDRRRTF
eukprot:11169615-Prorocentrum_lima.AAC.1